MKKLSTIFSLLLIISGGLFAQSGSIMGTVVDEKGEKLFGVNVFVEINGNLKGQPTDPDGKFTIRPLNPGSYTVKFKAIGYKPVEQKNIIVTSEKITFADVTMESSVENIDEFVVVEWKEPLISKDEPTVQSLSFENVKRDVNNKEPIRMLSSIAGVKVAENGRDVYVRGSRPQSTDYYVDGVRSINKDIGIPGTAIGSIKAYTGGVPAMYGDVTGGVIVIETKSYFDLLQQSK